MCIYIVYFSFLQLVNGDDEDDDDDEYSEKKETSRYYISYSIRGDLTRTHTHTHTYARTIYLDG